MHYPIPKQLQKSVFDKAGARNFHQAKPVQKLALTSGKADFCRWKFRDAGAVKNRFLKLFGYTTS